MWYWAGEHTRLICSAHAQLEPLTFVTHHVWAWSMMVTKKMWCCFILGGRGTHIKIDSTLLFSILYLTACFNISLNSLQPQ